MSYAALADLISHAGDLEILQVADRDDDGIADPDVIAAALAKADERINAWLGGRVQLPMSTVPAIVKSWAVSIARYHLHRDGAPDHVVKDYDDAVKELQAAAAGKIALPGVDGIAPPAPSGSGITSSCPDAVFTRKNMEGFL